LKDHLPPYNEEAEMATLGALLLNFSINLFEEVRQFVRVEDFFKEAHRLVFKAITSLMDKGEGVDLLTLTTELRSSGNIEKAGGSGYVAALTERVPSTANVAYYAKLVQDASIRRSLLNIAYKLISDAHNQTLETRLVIEEIEKSIFNLNDNQSRGELKPALEVVRKTTSIIEDRYVNKKNYTGIPSGFDALDRLTCGFQKSEMIIIGSRPSIGKTSLALSMATNIAIKNKIPCGFFTLEMSAISLMQRIISAESRINSNSLRTGLLKGKDFERIIKDAGRIYDAPLIFQDTPSIPLLDLRSLARRMVSKHKVEIVFIDYIGLVSPENSKQDRHEQISQISRSLKALARELNIPIVVLSQVGRQSEGKTPSLADLRESGALEQDADVVLLLHGRRASAEDEEDHESGSIIKTDLIVAKQRNGPTDTVHLAFVPHYTRFENLQPYSYRR